MQQDVIVVGGGVIGLLTCLELVDAGAKVLLIEKGQIGREASWAGGGIVSPLYPWRYSAAVTQLASWAQDYYPALARRLIEEVGIDPELSKTGLMMLDAEDESAALTWATQHARHMTPCTAQQIYAKEPQLGPGFNSGLWMPEVSNVRNPRLLKALRKRLADDPSATFIEHCDVLGLLRIGQQIIGVNCSTGQYFADTTIVAAGAWSGQLLRTLDLNVPVAPVRGQMLLYKECAHYIGSIVLTAGKYLIPRRDGRLLVGSTLEKVGFDKTTTSAGRSVLLEAALRLVPALAEHTIERHWSGLRPGSPDGIPLIGAVPSFHNLYLNCGHYRNGLVLAPASAKLLVESLQGRQTTFDPLAYQPEGRLTEGPIIDAVEI